MAKPELRVEARRLRKEEGIAVGKIAKELGVSKGSISYWVRDIELTKEQKAKLIVRSGYNRYQGSIAVKEKYLQIRKEAQKKGRDKVKNNQASDLYKAGCLLYWAEGGKTVNHIDFTNSDIEMMKVFVKFLRECMNVGNDDITIRLNCHLNNGLTIEEIENFWLMELGNLSRGCLRKHTIQYGDKSRGVRKLKYGICSVRVCNVKIIQEIFGAIQAMFNFDNLEWLR